MTPLRTLQEIVTAMVDSTYTSAEANMRSLHAARDSYHLQRAIHYYGEKEVVAEAAKILQARKGYTYAEASVEAGIRVSAALEQIDGQGIFKTVRNNLSNPQQQSQRDPGDDFDLTEDYCY